MSERRRGTSLAELAVVMAIFTLLGLAVFLVVSRGCDFYRDSATVIEVREQSLLGITRMTREIAESNLVTMNVANTTTNQGIVFCSPRDQLGAIKPTSDGKLAWTTWICYYVGDVDLSVGPNVTCLLRRDQALPVANTTRPPDPLNCINLSPPQPNRTPAYFRALAGNPRVCCRRITDLGVALDTDSVTVTLTCQLSTRYQYTSTLKTKVVPRF